MNSYAQPVTGPMENVSFKNIVKHARFVLTSKIILSGVAFLLLLVIIVLPLTKPTQKQLKVSAAPSVSDSPSVTKMDKPRYQGLDNKNQPYSVTALSATQETEDKVVLSSTNSDLTTADGRWMSLLSDSGLFTMSSKKLYLSGNVNLFTGEGYEMRTHSAIIDLAKNTATGKEKVTVQGIPGTLRASGFVITNQGNNIFFTGPVHMVIYPSKKK